MKKLPRKAEEEREGVAKKKVCSSLIRNDVLAATSINNNWNLIL